MAEVMQPTGELGPELNKGSKVLWIIIAVIGVIILLSIGGFFVIKSTIEGKVQNYSASLGDNARGTGTDTTGDNTGTGAGGNGGAETSISLDDSTGIKCISSSTTYYFKNGQLRREQPISSFTQINLQVDDNTNYLYTGGVGECNAIKSTPPQSYSDAKETIVGAYESVKGTGQEDRPGAVSCTEESLSDSLFELPAGCQILG